MKSQVLHTVWCKYFWWGCRENYIDHSWGQLNKKCSFLIFFMSSSSRSKSDQRCSYCLRWSGRCHMWNFSCFITEGCLPVITPVQGMKSPIHQYLSSGDGGISYRMFRPSGYFRVLCLKRYAISHFCSHPANLLLSSPLAPLFSLISCALNNAWSSLEQFEKLQHFLLDRVAKFTSCVLNRVSFIELAEPPTQIRVEYSTPPPPHPLPCICLLLSISSK